MTEPKKLLEWSKNDPIPEITRMKSGLAIILLGTPGIGKSTFVKDFILNRNRNFKVINPDDISATYTKDDTGKLWYVPASDLATQMIKNIIPSKYNFIYDVTGNTTKRILDTSFLAKDGGYKLIFIHLIGELEKSISQNLQRARKVPLDYLRNVYSKSQSFISKYSAEVKPDAYYVILSINGNYKFLRYEDGKLLKRKVDKYVEKE